MLRRRLAENAGYWNPDQVGPVPIELDTLRRMLQTRRSIKLFTGRKGVRGWTPFSLDPLARKALEDPNTKLHLYANVGARTIVAFTDAQLGR